MGKLKNKTQIKEKQSSDKLLLVGFLALILLHIIGGFWHSYYSWGFSYWSVLSTITIIVSGVVSIVALFVTYYYRSKIKLEFIDNLQYTNKSKTSSTIFLILISVLLFIVLYFFRSRAHIYGDGYAILDFCSTNTPLEITDQYYLQLLTVYWHQFFFKVLSPLGFLNQEEIFALTNVLGGVVGFTGVYKITGLLARTSRERIFFLVISLSSASIILFFGYIENYTWAMSFMLWTIYYTIRYIHKTCSVYPLLLFSLIAFSFHMINLTIIATIVILMLYKNILTKQFMHNLKRFHFVAYVIIGSLLILFLTQLKELNVFVPLWSLPDNNYSLFTFSHLSDIVNLLLLLAPLGLIFFLISLKNKKNNDLINDLTENFLFIISLLTFLSACFIDPQLGMIRDWDLFAFYGIPLTLWSGYRITRIYSEKEFPLWIIIASSIVLIVHLVPNIYEKNNPEIAIEYLDKVIWDDPHYQTTYNDAFRGLPWGYILGEISGKQELAGKYYTRSMKTNAHGSTPLYNIGLIHYEQKQFDSARFYFQKGIELNRQDPKLFSRLSMVEFAENNYNLAEEYARESIRLDSNHIVGLTNLAVSLVNQNKKEEAFHYFRKAYELDSNNKTSILNLGVIYAQGINIDSAYYFIKKAILILSEYPENERPQILVNIISLLLAKNHKSEAIEYLNQLKTIAPNYPLIREIEKEIHGK